MEIINLGITKDMADEIKNMDKTGVFIELRDSDRFDKLQKKLIKLNDKFWTIYEQDNTDNRLLNIAIDIIQVQSEMMMILK